jgi:hypothetical protein
MKSWLKAVMASAVAVMVVAGLISFAHAGGGVNWKVKVFNPTSYAVRVDLDYGALGMKGKAYVINSGSSHTFETGADCPVKLGGLVLDLGFLMSDKCINSSQDTRHCTISCTNSQWKITDRQEFVKD